jgi:hypothetical protein
MEDRVRLDRTSSCDHGTNGIERCAGNNNADGSGLIRCERTGERLRRRTTLCTTGRDDLGDTANLRQATGPWRWADWRRTRRRKTLWRQRDVWKRDREWEDRIWQTLHRHNFAIEGGRLTERRCRGRKVSDGCQVQKRLAVCWARILDVGIERQLMGLLFLLSNRYPKGDLGRC